MEFLVSEDVKSLMTQFKDQENQLQLKRRWLVGHSMSKSEESKLFGSKSKNNRTIPESLLREDDVFYETVKTFVEMGVGGIDEERKLYMFSKTMMPFNLRKDVRPLLSLLDDMTNKGLYNLADIVTHGSVNFEKTRWKMKKIIKTFLPKKLMHPNDELYEKLSLLFNDPLTFVRNPGTALSPTSQSYRVAVIKVLDDLDDFPTHALHAMHRKVRGIKGYIPQIKPPKSGWGREVLIGCLRRSCMEMLSKIGESNDLQEPLSKAMGVAGLTLKLILGCRHVIEFRKFSPEIEVLQTEIARAIWFLKKEVRFLELKPIQLLLDPDAELTNRSLRIAIRNLLTEYLFECSDLDSIPEWLPKVLAIINKKSKNCPYRYFSKKEMDKEVESIFSVSAQIKQIVWDLSPEHEFDQDFADLYMEDLEESDDEASFDYDETEVKPFGNNSRFCSYDSDLMESVGESNPTNFTPHPFATKNSSSPVHAPNTNLNVKVEPVHIARVGSLESLHCASNSSNVEEKVLDSPKTVDVHHYFGSVRSLGLINTDSLKTIENQRAYTSALPSYVKSVVKEEPKIYLESNFSCRELDYASDKESIDRSSFLAIQEASDETSLVAYRLVGRMLDEFAQSEGLELDVDDIAYLRSYEPNPKGYQVARKKSSSDKDDCGSVLIQLVEQLIPSFSESRKKGLEDLMDLS